MHHHQENIEKVQQTKQAEKNTEKAKENVPKEKHEDQVFVSLSTTVTQRHLKLREAMSAISLNNYLMQRYNRTPLDVPLSRNNCLILAIAAQVSNWPDDYSCHKFRMWMVAHALKNFEQFRKLLKDHYATPTDLLAWLREVLDEDTMLGEPDLLLIRDMLE